MLPLAFVAVAMSSNSTDMSTIGGGRDKWINSLAAVKALPPPVWAGLVAAGFGDARLFVTLEGDSDIELGKLFSNLLGKALKPKEEEDGVYLLRKAIQEAKVRPDLPSPNFLKTSGATRLGGVPVTTPVPPMLEAMASPNRR